MNIELQGNYYPFAKGQSMFMNYGLKSTRQKMERQEKCNNQVALLEEQKKNLKNINGSTVEEIAEKLDMLKGYEDEIRAAKMAYNHEQMMHVMDEAKEIGEKIREAAEKTRPKTKEEIKEEMIEEALGTDESKDALEELAEELSEQMENMEEEILETLTKEVANSEDLENIEELAQETAEEISKEQEMSLDSSQNLLKEEEWKRFYRPLNILA